MWLCEGKLKAKIAQFRLPSASHKTRVLSSLMTALYTPYDIATCVAVLKQETTVLCSVLYQKANILEVSVKQKCFVAIPRCQVTVVDQLMAAMMIDRCC